MMKFDRDLLDSVSAGARVSPRLRMNRDLRNSPADGSQRMLNALEPGTELPVHRHAETSESCIVLRGAAEEIFYDDQGKETLRVVMRPASDCVGVNIPAGTWHRIAALETGTVIFEAKDGAYEPASPNDIMNV